MSDPFVGYRARGPKPAAKNHHANKWIGNTPKTQRGRTPRDSITFFLDPALAEWIRDRAAILDVPMSALVRDVFAMWRNLVIATENKMGVNLDGVRVEIPLEERYPGYLGSVVPSAAHTDAVDMSLGDL
jgi:hypothetical protein